MSEDIIDDYKSIITKKNQEINFLYGKIKDNVQNNKLNYKRNNKFENDINYNKQNNITSVKHNKENINNFIKINDQLIKYCNALID